MIRVALRDAETGVRTLKLILEPGNLERLETEEQPIVVDLHVLARDIIPFGTVLIIDYRHDIRAAGRELVEQATRDGAQFLIEPPDPKGVPS